MRLRPGWLVVLAACLVAPATVALTAAGPAAAAVPLSACASADNGLPTVTGTTLTPPVVSTSTGPGAVDVSATVTDTGGPGAASGVAQVSVQLVGPAGRQLPERPLRMALSDAGTWEARVAIPVGTLAGNLAAGARRRRRGGNSTTARLDADTDPGAGIEVRGPADSVAPMLVGLRLDRHRLDTRQHAAVVQVTARVRSGLAQLRRVTVTAAAGRRFVTVPLHRVRSSAGASTWLGPLRIPTWVGDGRWMLRVALVDRVGNVRQYSAANLATLGHRHHVDGSLVVKSRVDRRQPTATGLTFTPPSVDVSTGDVQVQAAVRARDAASGVIGVQLRLFDPDNSDVMVDTRLMLTAGTALDGTWQAAATIPHCGAVPGTWNAQLLVTDRSGRVHHYFAGQPTLVVTNTDTVAPRVVRTSTAAGLPVLDFSEDVTGISAASAPVTSRADGSALPGTWRCDDVSAAPVSCASGAVRRATYSSPSAVPAEGISVAEPRARPLAHRPRGQPGGPPLLPVTRAPRKIPPFATFSLRHAGVSQPQRRKRGRLGPGSGSHDPSHVGSPG